MSGSPVHARKPHGRPCLFTGNDQSGGRRGRRQAPFQELCFKFRFKTALRAQPSRVFGNRGAFPGWQVRSRGCLPRGPRPSRLGNLVTWKVGPLLPVWVEAGGTGCRGWRNQNPRRRETGFLLGGHPCCRRMWLGGRKMPVTFVRLETKTERGCFPAALPANAGDMRT